MCWLELGVARKQSIAVCCEWMRSQSMEDLETTPISPAFHTPKWNKGRALTGVQREVLDKF